MRGISASRLCRLVMSGDFCVALKASGCIECNLGVAQIRELLHLHRLRLLLYFASFAVLHEQHPLLLADSVRGAHSDLPFERPLQELATVLEVELSARETVFIQLISGRYLC